MSHDKCHHTDQYCPGCVEPITDEGRADLFPPAQKVYSAVVLARYEARVRELEAELERVRARDQKQLDYSIALQRLIEYLNRGEPEPQNVSDAAPHHARIAARIRARLRGDE